MPLYEYECPRCRHRFEQICKISEPNPPCPACGEAATKKVPTIFRANAWSNFLDGMEKKVSPEKFR